MWTDEAQLGSSVALALVGAAFDASDITPPNLGHPSHFMEASMDLTTAAAGVVQRGLAFILKSGYRYNFHGILGC